MSNIAPLVSFKRIKLKFAAPSDTKTKPVFEENPHIDHSREMLRVRDRYERRRMLFCLARNGIRRFLG